MLHPVTFRSLAIVACGWLLACDAMAVSLGRARGAVLLGRPLEMTVQVSDAGQDPPCAAADVFYGDTRVTGGASVRWEPGTNGEGVLRVISNTLVDEPMVTLYVRAGCGSTTTRRYVLLSEMPPEAEPATPVVRVQPPAVAPSRPAPPAATVPPAAATVPPAATRRQAAAAPAVASRTLRVPPAARARLKLEPLDLSVDRDPVLRLSPELRTDVVPDPQRRQAAAALWQVLQRGPEQAVQEALRLQGAERELKSVHEDIQRNASAVTQLRGEVVRARTGRSNASAAIVALAVALLALLAWLAWRWRRDADVARVGRWFEGNSELAQPPMPIVDAAAARRMTLATAQPVRPPAPPPHPAPLTPMPKAAAPSSAWPPSDEFQASRGASVRMVGVEELIDIHDKADFFLSIGEHRQAIAALEAHVHDQVETSALAWMDLLELYHRFGHHAEYERLRAEFQQRFAVQVPDFEHFDQPTASLENYGRALSRIVALWPSRKVLDVIEESIFRQPGLPGAEPFSLEAYRDLVLLYHVARDMLQEDEAPPASSPATNFQNTSLQPLNAFDATHGTAGAKDRLLIPPSSPRLGVDIDLGEDDAPSEMRPLDFDISGYEPSGTGSGGDEPRR